MNTLDILDYISPHGKCNVFKGVFACDTIPYRFSYPALFVVNLSKKAEIGSHWIAIYIDQSLNCYYFDSFGFPPKNKFISAFMKKKAKRIFYNRKQLQHVASINCGKYCCLFCVSIMKYHTIDKFIQRFSKNLYVNEIVVERMFQNLKIRN